MGNQPNYLGTDYRQIAALAATTSSLAVKAGSQATRPKREPVAGTMMNGKTRLALLKVSRVFITTYSTLSSQC